MTLAHSGEIFERTPTFISWMFRERKESWSL